MSFQSSLLFFYAIFLTILVSIQVTLVHNFEWNVYFIKTEFLSVSKIWFTFLQICGNGAPAGSSQEQIATENFNVVKQEEVLQKDDSVNELVSRAVDNMRRVPYHPEDDAKQVSLQTEIEKMESGYFGPSKKDKLVAGFLFSGKGNRKTIMGIWLLVKQVIIINMERCLKNFVYSI